MKTCAGCRYGTYKLVQKMPGGEKMVAFTRILHRQKPDVIMDEVTPLSASSPIPGYFCCWRKCRFGALRSEHTGADVQLQSMEWAQTESVRGQK